MWSMWVVGAFVWTLCSSSLFVGGDSISDLFSNNETTVGNEAREELPIMQSSRRQLHSLAHIRQGAFGIQSETKSDVPKSSDSSSSQFGIGPSGCTINDCEGVNLLASIRKDLEQWKLRGGINLADTDAAQRRGCAVGEEDGHFFGCVPGWVRVMIVNNTLYATHFGEGFGTRDGVFLVSLLELLAKYGKEVPDVDFVLQPGDRAKVPKHTNPQGAKWLALMLSFAVHPDFQEIGIPDPSFWSWPEMGVPPHWHVNRDPDIVQWYKKSKSAFWRGGSNRRFGGATRKELMGCPRDAPEALKSRLDLADAMRLAAHKNISKIKECKSACLEWVGPMHMCKYKIAVFAQGEGFTSSKQRVLACGSLPAFLSHDKMDSYYGKWLVAHKHYKPLRPGHVCEDLKNLVWWAEENDAKAEQIGVNARRFATRILGEEMVHTYLLQVLKEVASLLTYRPRDAFPLVHKQLDKLNALPATMAKLQALREKNGPKSTLALEKMIKLTPKTIAESFRDREERKGAMIEAALAYTKYAKVDMAPPHPSSAKYAHIINKNASPAAGGTTSSQTSSSSISGPPPKNGGGWKKKWND